MNSCSHIPTLDSLVLKSFCKLGYYENFHVSTAYMCTQHCYCLAKCLLNNSYTVASFDT